MMSREFLGELEHFSDNQKANVATLRWCSAGRKTVRLSLGSVRLRWTRQWTIRLKQVS